MAQDTVQKTLSKPSVKLLVIDKGPVTKYNIGLYLILNALSNRYNINVII